MELLEKTVRPIHLPTHPPLPLLTHKKTNSPTHPPTHPPSTQVEIQKECAELREKNERLEETMRTREEAFERTRLEASITSSSSSSSLPHPPPTPSAYTMSALPPLPSSSPPPPASVEENQAKLFGEKKK